MTQSLGSTLVLPAGESISSDDWRRLQIDAASAEGRARAEREAQLSAPIISRSDAMLLAGCAGRDGAFESWCRKWKIKSVAYGRYSRAQVMRALETEAGHHGHAARKRALGAAHRVFRKESES